MLPLTILTLVCILTYSFEIVFGLAGTILMLPLLSFLYDTKTLVIYSVLPQVLVATIGLARSPRTVRLDFLAKMLGFAALGMIAGFAFFYYLSAGVFQILLAGAITLSGLYLIVAPARFKLHAAGARLLDTLGGATQALFGISGPIAMTRLLATFPDKTVVRNYAFAFFLPLNLARGIEYLVHDTYTPEIGQMMLVSAPFLVVALWGANHLHFKVNERHFRRVVAWIILLGGISLFYR